MLHAIREKVTVKPGGVLELYHPELPAGTEAEVIIMVQRLGATPREPLASFVGRIKGCFASAEEVDTHIRKERDTWSQ